MSRIYIAIDKETGSKELIRANTNTTARGHVYEKIFGERIDVHVANQAELEEMFTSGKLVTDITQKGPPANPQLPIGQQA